MWKFDLYVNSSSTGNIVGANDGDSWMLELTGEEEDETSYIQVHFEWPSVELLSEKKK